jgi:hypothetical protein
MSRAPILLSLMVMLSACGPVVSANPSGSVAPTATPVPATAEPTGSATVSPAPAVLRIDWSEQAFEGSIGAVMADRGQFVAVGEDSGARAAWSSPDGRDWVKHAVPDPAPDDCAEFYDPRCFPNSASMGQVVRLGDTVYSIGTTASFNDYLAPVGWRLTDGEAWQAIHSESPFYGFGLVTDLTASGGALVASKFGAAAFTSVVWRWTPQSSWVATDLVGSAAAPIEIFDTTWGRNTFLAIGLTAESVDGVGYDQWPTSPSLWTSVDGLSWNAAAPFPPSATLCSVTATTKGFVVLGTTDVGAAVWLSPDATTWVQFDLGPPAGATPDPYGLFGSCAVTEVGGGLLAFRTIAQGTLTWLSTDGDEWTAGPTLDVSANANQVAALRDTVVLAGYRGGAPDGATPVLLVGSVHP